MKVLGISGKERHAAAAVSIDGAVAAAAAEESFARVRHIGYRHTGGYPLSAIDACLTRASLTYAEIDRVIVVDDERSGEDDPRRPILPRRPADCSPAPADETLERELRTRPHESVVPALADARQLTAVCQDEDLLRDRAGTGSRRIGDLRTARGATDAAARCTPAVLRDQANGRCARPGRVRAYNAIERLGALAWGQHSPLFERAITWELGPRLRAERRGARTCALCRCERARQHSRRTPRSICACNRTARHSPPASARA